MLAQNLAPCPLSWLLPGASDQSTCTAVTRVSVSSVSPDLCSCRLLLLPTAVAVPQLWHRGPLCLPHGTSVPWLLQLAVLVTASAAPHMHCLHLPLTRDGSKDQHGSALYCQALLEEHF